MEIESVNIKQEMSFSCEENSHQEAPSPDIFESAVKNFWGAVIEDGSAEHQTVKKDSKADLQEEKYKIENKDFAESAPDNNTNYEECEVDGKNCIDNLIKVEEIHYETTDKLFNCTQCQFKCKQKQILTDHIICRHTEERPIECTKCDFTTTTKHYLRRHMIHKHTPANFKWHCCDKCSYKAKFKKYIRQHILYKHTSEDSLEFEHCDQCSYKAKTKHNLQRHVASMHTTCREFKCESCDSTFNRREHLKKHITLKHTPDDLIKTWFDCGQCSKKYKDKSSFKKHVQRRHPLVECKK